MIKKILGLNPARVPPHVFEVDETGLRYAGFAAGQQGLEVEVFEEEELEPGLFPEGPLAGPLRDPDRFAESLSLLLGRLSSVPAEASLVLPDRWLRLSFASARDVPAKDKERDAVLRFKLKRLVPFRVEDLRVAAVEVPAFNMIAGSAPEEADNDRLLLGFAREELLGQFESVFGQQQVKIGQITSRSLSLLTGLRPLIAGLDVGAVIYSRGNSYTLMLTQHGALVIHRFKSFTEEGGRRDLIPLDLRLTRRFVSEQIPGASVREVLLVSPAEEEKEWEEALFEAFEAPVRCLTRDWGDGPGRPAGIPLYQSAVLLGAVLREVA